MSKIIEDIRPVFDIPSFYDMFVLLNSKYNELEFQDVISDGERIAEYKWINQQIRKYITKTRGIVLSRRNKDEVLAEVENLISKTEEYGDSRKEIVYNILRDQFLMELYTIVDLYQEEQEEEDE